MNKIRNYWKNKKGITLVWGAFFLVLCLMFLGLAVDIAYMYVVKNQLQVAADAAALAGVSQLDCSNDTVQTLARREAISFALKNTAAGQAVEVQTDYTNTLSPANDITVGYWNQTTRIYTPDNGTGTSTVNAIEVRPQRASGLTGNRGPVGLFLGKIFGWNVMSARASAIACRPPLGVPGITICVPTCTAGPSRLILQKDPKSVPINDGMGWTAFNDKQAPNIGANGDVVQYIRGELTPPPPCDLCMVTNNGTGDALQVLKDVFESTTLFRGDKIFDGSGNVISWKVALPVVDKKCNCDCPCPTDCSDPSDTTNPFCDPLNCACPPGGQPEPYHVAKVATLNITSVITTGSTKGIDINNIQCVDCPTSWPCGSGVKLVQ